MLMLSIYIGYGLALCVSKNVARAGAELVYCTAGCRKVPGATEGVKKSLAIGQRGSAACCAESLRLSGKRLTLESLVLSLRLRKG